MQTLVGLAVRSLIALLGVGIVTLGARTLQVNVTTVGFAYLLLVLLVAGTWGFVEASLVSIAATLAFNFFFLPPFGTFVIADPQNWVALFSFLATALVASRLSTIARRRAADAIERQQDIERLYSFSRAILLIGSSESFGKQLTHNLVEIFELSAALLFLRRTGEVYRAGPTDFEGVEDQLRDAALLGASFSDASRSRVITAVRLGSEPIASLALQGARMPDSVLQGISNLVAIGLERAKAQELAQQVEAARQSEQLRTTLIDAMVHEFKTPLTAIKAATSALMAIPEHSPESRRELLTIADEEAAHLSEFIDDTVEMARLDRAHIDIHPEDSDMCEIVRDAVASLRGEIEDRAVAVECDQPLLPVAVDRRLMRVAIKQLLDNALKYSPAGTPVAIRLSWGDGAVTVGISNEGEGIPPQEQKRIFERFYRGPSVKNQIPGSGLGLSIAHSIVQAHNGDLNVSSSPGQTTFRIVLPVNKESEIAPEPLRSRS